MRVKGKYVGMITIDIDCVVPDDTDLSQVDTWSEIGPEIKELIEEEAGDILTVTVEPQEVVNIHKVYDEIET